MAYNPISGAAIQYVTSAGNVASGYYLKFYIANTTTPLSMATDATGGSLLVKCKLNDKGYPISNPADNSTGFIPHVNASYRFVLYVNETDADANTTANADVNIPDIAAMVGAEGLSSQIHGGQFMTYGGTADVITLTSVNTVALTAVATGDLFRFRATATNTGATTINPDGIAAVAAVDVEGNALAAGYIRTDADTIATYDGTNYVIEIATLDQYHTTNLNQFEFGATGSVELIGTGFASSTTSLRVYFPISLFAPPTGFTVAGTFEITEPDGTVIDSGLGNADISISGVTSMKIGAVNVTTSGLTANAAYELRAESSSSKITVNP